MLSGKDFLYIIGSPRSGTTMLQILLSQHPQVASTVEQTLFQHYLAPWLKSWETERHNLEERGWKSGLPIHWKEQELVEFLTGFLEQAYAKILALKPDATHVLDKHPRYSLHTATIKRFVPRARFIHIIRDGRDVVSSMTAVNRKMGYCPGTVPLAARKWKTFVNGAREAAQFTDSYLEVRYEDFLARGVDVYAQILDFCGLPYTREWIEGMLAANTFEKMKETGVSADGRTKLTDNHYHRGVSGGWKTDFSAKDRYDFDRVAGKLLQELGFAQPGWWAEQASQRILQPLRYSLEKRKPLFLRALLLGGAAVLGRDADYYEKRRLALQQ